MDDKGSHINLFLETGRERPQWVVQNSDLIYMEAASERHLAEDIVTACRQLMADLATDIGKAEADHQGYEDGAYDAALERVLRRRGNQLRGILMSEDDADQLITKAKQHHKVILCDAIAEQIPWEMLYSPSLDMFGAEASLFCRPLAHARANMYSRGDAGRTLSTRPASWVLHDDAVKVIKQSLEHAHSKVVSVRRFDDFPRGPGVTVMVCECEAHPPTGSGHAEAARQRLNLTSDMAIEVEDIPLLLLPPGAFVVLLACTTRCDRIARDIARRYNATIVAPNSMMPWRSAALVALGFARLLEQAPASKKVTLGEFVSRLATGSRAQRVLLTVHGRTDVEIEL